MFRKIFFKVGIFGFYFFMYDFQHCFICRPSDSTVSEDAGIEPRTVVTTALAVRRSNDSPGKIYMQNTKRILSFFYVALLQCFFHIAFRTFFEPVSTNLESA
jgi:hypothetical protein